MRTIDKILIFCLFFVCISCYSQTNLIPTITNTYVNLEIGANYSGSKFGGSCRLSYDASKSVQVGLETDYVNGTLYQSSGNGKFGKTVATAYGDVFFYAISGVGLAFDNKVNNSTGLIALAGTGIGYITPFSFKLLNKYPLRLMCDLEIDKYSNSDNLVFKQYIGCRISF